jgi:apolipoprotein D and lipocalin family protein
MTRTSRRGTTIRFPLLLLLTAILTLGSWACGSRRGSQLQPLQRRIDLHRFMGKWYVLAHIPIDNIFASEADAYDAVEQYELEDDGSIATTFTFREGGFDGPEKVMRPIGFVHNEETNTEWRMQFVWPFKSAYLIVHLDDDYETTIVGVPDRSHAWIMARTPRIAQPTYDGLVGELRRMGHDISKLRKVPQSER